jgi:hypothetical protein
MNYRRGIVFNRLEKRREQKRRGEERGERREERREKRGERKEKRGEEKGGEGRGKREEGRGKRRYQVLLCDAHELTLAVLLVQTLAECHGRAHVLLVKQLRVRHDVAHLVEEDIVVPFNLRVPLLVHLASGAGQTPLFGSTRRGKGGTGVAALCWGSLADNAIALMRHLFEVEGEGWERDGRGEEGRGTGEEERGE